MTMKRFVKRVMILSVAAALTGCSNSNNTAGQAVAGKEPASTTFKIEKAGEMPDIEKGYGLGVSACYAAATDTTLFIAGGCNFPDTPAADGGSKIYYKGIYRTATAKPFAWEKIAELPAESAYGVTLQNGNKWYIIGGMNSNGALSTAYCIDIAEGAITPLPQLPVTVDNAAGAIAGNTLYITGGNADGKASNRTFSLEAGSSQWRELPAMPSAPRVQPVCAATAGHLYVWGGFTPGTKESAAVHCDGVRYSLATGEWEKLGNITAGEDTITLSGGFAAAAGNGTIIAAGGVDKDIFLDAITGTWSITSKEEYMHHPTEWYKFNSRLMLYDAAGGKWSVVAEESDLSRAGAVLAVQGERIFQIGGELKPGIRTPGIFVIAKGQASGTEQANR